MTHTSRTGKTNLSLKDVGGSVLLFLFALSGIFSLAMTLPDGGLLGRLNILVFYSWLNRAGTYIVDAVILLIAVILFTGFSISQSVKRISGRTEEEKLLKIQLSHYEAEVSIGEIVAVLSNNHSVDLKMITGEILESNMLFSDIQSSLENEPNFLECNRGIIINMDYAVQIKGDTIIMQNGTGYPVRRRGRKEISAKFT